MAERNALERYILTLERALRDRSALEELRSLFAEDATIQLVGPPVVGISAIMQFYRNLLNEFAEWSHYFSTSVLDDGSLQVEWVLAARLRGGGLMTHCGVERAYLNPSGQISSLVNRLP